MKLKEEFFNDDLTIAESKVKAVIQPVIDTPLADARKLYGQNFTSFSDVKKYERQCAFYKDKFKILHNGNAYVGEISKNETKGNYNLEVKFHTYNGLKQHHLIDVYSTTYVKEVLKEGKIEKQTAYKNNCYQNIWINSEDTPSYENIVFIPGDVEPKPKYLNIWQGMIEPIKGDISMFNEFVEGLIENPNDREELIKLLAYTVQFPEEPGQRFTVFKGSKGCGKTFIVKNIIGRLIPYHYRTIEDFEFLCGKWNYITEFDKIILVDEIQAKSVKLFRKRLQAITGNTGLRTMTRRNNDERQILNCLTIFGTSDSEQAFSFDGSDERRLHIIKVSDKYKGDLKFFKNLRKWVENGGKNHLIEYLLNYDLGEWTPRIEVKNAEKNIERRNSLEPVLQKLVDIGNNEFQYTQKVSFINKWCEDGLKIDRTYFEKAIELQEISQSQLTRLVNRIFKFEERNGKHWSQNMNGKYVWPSLNQYQKDLSDYIGISEELLFEGNVEDIPISNEADAVFEENYNQETD